MDEGYTHGQMTALDALAGYVSGPPSFLTIPHA